MATRERQGDTFLDHPSSFDPTAVPRAPDNTLGTAAGETLRMDEDLISLGEEPLFTGGRGVASASRETGIPARKESTVSVVSEELVRSLGAARQAFLSALSAIVLGAATGARTFEETSQEIHQTPGNGTPPAAPSSDTVLSSLLENLRLRSSSNTATSSRTSLVAPTDVRLDEETKMEELRSRVDTLALDLPLADAELARSLGALLPHIERLLTICRPATVSGVVPVAALERLDSPNLYKTLEREAETLRSNKDQRTAGEVVSVVGAIRDVESAERDVLWGRVDELSERVGALCRERQERQLLRGHSVAPSVHSFELPRYSTDHRPPAYLPDSAVESKSHLDEKDAGPSQSRRGASSDEKMQIELDTVSSAIERLYLVSPQLANQRVDPDRRVVRERQLAKLGNAIERLSKGRLNDQRAAAGPLVHEGVEQKAARMRRADEAALDVLIDQIDRAASRTLVGQRVTIGAKGKSTQRLSNPTEAQREEFIIEHTGKGRLDSQDATFSTSRSTPFPPHHPVPAVSLAEFFHEQEGPIDPRPRSHSLPSNSLLGRRRSSGGPILDEDKEATTSTSGPNLLLSMFKKGGIPAMLRRGSYDSRSEVELRSASQAGTSSNLIKESFTYGIEYAAEESRNLGTVVVTFWPSSVFPGSTVWDAIVVGTDTILVTSSKSTYSSRIPLPCRVGPQNVVVISRGAFFEVKLTTIDASPTKARPDLEVHAPLSTAQLRDSLPLAFACAKCRTTLVDASKITKYNALPSEHWAELLDAWMCHQDQALSDDLIAKGKGIKPREFEGLVGSAYVVFRQDVTSNWHTPEKSEPTRSEADDLLYPAYCTSCDSLIGQHVMPLCPDSTPTHLRLLKYATYPTEPSPPTHPNEPSRRELPRYSLASHLTAEMLEIGQAHACHRFVVEDSETETIRLLLWLFNPAIRVSFSTASASGSILEAPNPSNSSVPPTNLIERTLNAVKVFYTVVVDANDPSCLEFIDSDHSTTERITYPRAVTDSLIALLRASSAVYPLAKRTWGVMDAGFLERI